MSISTLRPLYLALGFGAVYACTAQNLVPNPSFEAFHSCPNNFSEIGQVLDWNSLYLSPDYYNECSEPTTGFDIPLNASGYQSSFEGSGYIGIITYEEVGAREYVQARLAGPLTPGQTTSISMRLSPGGFGITNWASPRYSCRGVGVRFSVNELPYGVQELTGAVMHLDQVLIDTLNWSIISSDYVPDSAYEYIQIGNFFDDLYSSPIVIDPLGDAQYGYAFIDAVCVSPDPLFCSMGTGIEQNDPDQRGLFGNLFDGRLKLSASNTKCDAMLSLSDVQGRNVWRGNWPSGLAELNVPIPALSPGTYLLTIQAERSRPRALRLVQSVGY